MRDKLDRHLYEHFAQRCEQRLLWVIGLIDAEADRIRRGVDADDSGDGVLAAIVTEFDDLLGDAQILGLGGLSSVVSNVVTLMRSEAWTTVLRDNIKRQQLRSWVHRLIELAKRIALEPPTNSTRQELMSLEDAVAEETRGEPFDGGATADLTPVSGHAKRVLLFDDSPIVREMAAIELSERGYAVETAGDVREFHSKLSLIRPAVVVLDINMPDFSGDDICNWLRAREETRTLPIVFLSSIPEQELAQRAKESRADAYVSKEHGLEKLAECLDEMLTAVVL